MQSVYSGGSGAANFVGTSLNGIFLIHFMQALDRLQQYLGEGGEDEEQRWMKVNLQFQYLLHLLPRDTQEAILELVDAKEVELKEKKEYSGSYTSMYVSRMEIVTEVVTYLTASLDLVNEDIIAGLTQKAKDHALAAKEVVDID